MRKLFILFLFILSSSGVAQIDLKNPTAISLNGGFFMPYSSETFKTGVSIGFDIQQKINPVYAFLNLSYNISARNNRVESESYSNTSSTGILEVSIGPRLYIGRTSLEYFIDGGVGMYLEKKGSYDIKINGVTTSYPSESNISLGGNIGVGGEFPITDDLDFVGRAKYHLYFGVGDSQFINAYFGVLGGVKYYIRF